VAKRRAKLTVLAALLITSVSCDTGNRPDSEFVVRACADIDKREPTQFFTTHFLADKSSNRVIGISRYPSSSTTIYNNCVVVDEINWACQEKMVGVTISISRIGSRVTSEFRTQSPGREMLLLSSATSRDFGSNHKPHVPWVGENGREAGQRTTLLRQPFYWELAG
jgi:hypothetical protein